MHHTHPGVTVVILIFVAAFAVIGLLVWLAFRWRQRLYTGPLRDQWNQERQDLSRRQRFRLWRANIRQRPVDQPELAAAQFAFTRYAEDTFRRSPMVRRRWVRILLPCIYLACAAVQVAIAFGQSRVQVVNLIVGVFFVATAVLWGYVALWGLNRSRRKLVRLREQLQRRYGDDLAQV